MSMSPSPPWLRKRDELLEIRLQGLHVDVRRLLVRQHQHHFGEARVLAQEGEQQEEDQLAQARLDLPHHPQVEEVDRAVPPEQVSGVRIGVEEAVQQDLAVVLGGAAGRHRCAPRTGRVADGDALDLPITRSRRVVSSG